LALSNSPNVFNVIRLIRAIRVQNKYR